MIHPDIASDPEKLAIYKKVLKKDGSVRFAEMCALQCPPGARNTDRAFSQGAVRQMSRMDPENREAILQIAKKAGISTQGKCHKAGIGRPDDPAAWVSTMDDVLAVAKARNLEISGAVTHKAVRDLSPPPKVALAEDIVKKLVASKLASDKSLASKVKKNPRKLQEVREAVIAKHGRKK